MVPNCLGTVGSRGCKGQNPVLRDADARIVNDCKRAAGGDKTVGVPQYTLKVINPPEPQIAEESAER